MLLSHTLLGYRGHTCWLGTRCLQITFMDTVTVIVQIRVCLLQQTIGKCLQRCYTIRARWQWCNLCCARKQNKYVVASVGLDATWRCTVLTLFCFQNKILLASLLLPLSLHKWFLCFPSKFRPIMLRFFGLTKISITKQKGFAE